jgi:amino acid adenylation domain-containing protein
MLIQQTVTNQAERRPGAIAMVSKHDSITYGELEDASNRLARLLRSAGCQKGDRVGLLAPKSIPAIVAMIAALKAECVYVPMDTSSPAPRLAKIVASAEPKCILGSGPAAGLLETLGRAGQLAGEIRIGWLDSGGPDRDIGAAFSWEHLAQTPSHSLPCRTNEQEAAHILFTSGSTGTPKGVVITHSNAASFIEWATKYFQTSSSDRISGHPPLHFDMSTFDIFGTFLAGAQLYLVPPEINLLPHKIAEFIRRNSLTQWMSVPSVFKYIAQFDALRPNDFPSLKRVLWCGEALPTPTLMYWMKRLPSAKFTNLYGPTEATISSSYYTVPECPTDERAEIPIGRPCDGEDLMVLDEGMRPAPPGETGDLYIRGVGLSPGYWRDPEKTAAAFLIGPDGERIYKTGDLARLDEDGLFYLLGRSDSQIKSRGYRIELGEIESALHALGVLRECAVVAVQTDSFEGASICCAYSPAEGTQVSPSDLRQRLSEALPPYMLPAQWKPLDSLPLNGNGKIDRPRLREHFMTARTVA